MNTMKLTSITPPHEFDLVAPEGLQVDFESGLNLPMTVELQADFNADGDVDGSDLAELARMFSFSVDPDSDPDPDCDPDPNSNTDAEDDNLTADFFNGLCHLPPRRGGDAYITHLSDRT